MSWIQSDRWAPRWAELSGLKSHHQPPPNYWVIFISRWQMSQLHHQQLCPLSHHCLNNFLPKRKIEFVKWWKEQLQSPRRHTHTHTLWPSPSSLTKRKHAEFKDGEGTVWQQLSLSDLYPNTIMPRHQYDGGNNGDWKKVSDHYLPDNGMKGYLDKWKKIP